MFLWTFPHVLMIKRAVIPRSARKHGCMKDNVCVLDLSRYPLYIAFHPLYCTIFWTCSKSMNSYRVSNCKWPEATVSPVIHLNNSICYCCTYVVILFSPPWVFGGFVMKFTCHF